jgi:hypothetical protein
MRLAFKKLGLAAGLIAAVALAGLAEPALAKKALRVPRQPFNVSYRLSDVGTECVERSASVSVGNPAYRKRLATWPAPCY